MDFMENHPAPTCDADRNIAPLRAVGGFGFPNPTCLMCTPAQPVNTIDITQGAAQALCECTRHILTRKGEHLRLNLWLSWDAPAAEVVSALPLQGGATLRLKEGGLLSLRIPRGIEPGSFALTVNGKPRDWVEVEGYAFAGRVEPGDAVEAFFTPCRAVQAEFICHKRYEVEWFGEQAIAVTPVKGYRPLFRGISDGTHVESFYLCYTFSNPSLYRVIWKSPSERSAAGDYELCYVGRKIFPIARNHTP